MTRDGSKGEPAGGQTARAAREHRLAEALRANLKKRKAAAAGSDVSGADRPPETATGATDHRG